MLPDTSSLPMWALIVTGGTVIEYPPELYADRARAVQEAERWAWVLSGAGWAEIERPFTGRWEVGEHDVRLVEAESTMPVGYGQRWVGTFWDRSGSPDPEAIVFDSRNAAREWVLEPPGFDPPIQTQELDWFVSATYLRGGEEEYAVAHLAKVVS
jgi:hypothetical protein